MLESWGIPWVSLTRTKTNIREAIADMVVPPRVLLTSISVVAEKEIQQQIRRLPIKVICIDECQVANPDKESGWSEILPYKYVTFQNVP